MQILILDGHPDDGRLLGDLLDIYASGLPTRTQITRIAVRDLSFDPILHRGYEVEQTLEPDLERAWDAILAADHLVIGFPLWWGGEPALLKGFWDRLLLPGCAFETGEGLIPKGLLTGRSADVIVTMDTPPTLMRTIMADPLGQRLRQIILGFCGVIGVRTYYFGPVADGAAEAAMPSWRRRLGRIARRAPGRWRGVRP